MKEKIETTPELAECIEDRHKFQHNLTHISAHTLYSIYQSVKNDFYRDECNSREEINVGLPHRVPYTIPENRSRTKPRNTFPESRATQCMSEEHWQSIDVVGEGGVRKNMFSSRRCDAKTLEVTNQQTARSLSPSTNIA